jgi:hypothetical protein
LLAKRMGKKKIIAETGAGQHGVATAATAALMGMECTIHMGAVDVERQKLNVFRMQMMGAKVVPAESGQKTLKEAVDEALMAWVQDAQNTFYLLGSAVGPHPYPLMVREFQSIVGREAKAQILEAEGRLPDYCIACVGGGSNAMGLFSEFIPHKEVRLVGVEPAGRGLGYGQHAATLCLGEPGVMHGFNSYMLKDQVRRARRGLFHLRRSRLPQRRPRARPPEGPGPRRVRARQRSRSPGRLLPALAHRGHHPGPGVLPCPGPCPAHRARPLPGDDHHRQPVGTRRQGRGPDRAHGRKRRVVPPTL